MIRFHLKQYQGIHQTFQQVHIQQPQDLSEMLKFYLELMVYQNQRGCILKHLPGSGSSSPLCWSFLWYALWKKKLFQKASLHFFSVFSCWFRPWSSGGSPPRLLTLSPPGPSGLPGLRPGLSGNSVHLRSRWAKSKFPANGSLQRLLLFLWSGAPFTATGAEPCFMRLSCCWGYSGAFWKNAKKKTAEKLLTTWGTFYGT